MDMARDLVRGDQGAVDVTKVALVLTRHRETHTLSPDRGRCTVTRRAVKFPYIHMMTPDDNGPRRENISRMRAGLLHALLRRFLTVPEFSRDILHEKKVKCEHRVGSNLRFKAPLSTDYPLSHSYIALEGEK
jgi:hypothetical protein